MATTAAAKPLTASQQLRKVRKPLIERKRRERINGCLNELKSLVLNALDKDEAQFSKLEKADILELALEVLKKRSSAEPSPRAPPAPAGDSAVAGFSQCALEAARCLGGMAGVRPEVRVHLTEHLAGCVQRLAATAKCPQQPLLPASSSSSPADFPAAAVEGHGSRKVQQQQPSAMLMPAKTSTGKDFHQGAQHQRQTMQLPASEPRQFEQTREDCSSKKLERVISPSPSSSPSSESHYHHQSKFVFPPTMTTTPPPLSPAAGGRPGSAYSAISSPCSTISSASSSSSCPSPCTSPESFHYTVQATAYTTPVLYPGMMEPRALVYDATDVFGAYQQQQQHLKLDRKVAAAAAAAESVWRPW